MITEANNYNIVIEILSSPSNSLSELAMISQRDPFSFYRGADLKNLDLSEQNLCGLNFDNADLRGTKLEGITYDLGAFNGSILDNSNLFLKDDFEFYASDVMTHPNDDILIFAKIRTGLIDYFINVLGMSYRHFSNVAEISTSSLRKARNGGVLAMETASAIIGAVDKLAVSLDAEIPHLTHRFRQPIFMFLSGGNNGNFVTLNRLSYIEIRNRRIELEHLYDKVNNKPGNPMWRSTPESLQWEIPHWRNQV